MNRKLLRSPTILTVLALTFSAAAWTVSSVHTQSTHQQSEDANSTRRKTLREIAQERDIEYIAHSESEVEWGDPVSITKYANAVILGRITKVESSFTESGEHIITNYQVDVRRLLVDKTFEVNSLLISGQEPPAPLTTPLTIVREGGVVSLNGHRAAIKVAGSDLLIAGKTYIFFLGWSPDFKAYTIVGGISGVVLVNDNLRIKPLASDEKVKLKYEGRDLETFISEVLLR